MPKGGDGMSTEMTGKQLLIFAVAGMIILSSMICYLTKVNLDRDVIYIEQGYTKATVAGHNSPIWVRPTN